MITYEDIPEVIDGIPTYVSAQYVDDDRPTLPDGVTEAMVRVPSRGGQIKQILLVLGALASLGWLVWQIVQGSIAAWDEGILWESIYYVFAPWSFLGVIWGLLLGRWHR